MLKLDLGCSKSKKESFLGVDMDPKSDAEFIWDLEKGLPFLNNSMVDEIYCRHVLEHIDNIILLIKEIYRVCKDGATVQLIVPEKDSNSAYELEHKRYFSLSSLICVSSPKYRERYGFNFRNIKNEILDDTGTNNKQIRAVLEVVKRNEKT